jgi:hypothetical protein
MEQEQSASHWWPTCGVMLGALTVSLTHGVLNVAVPNMMSSLGTDLDCIQWVQTAFQIAQPAVDCPATLPARVCGTPGVVERAQPTRKILPWLAIMDVFLVCDRDDRVSWTACLDT